MYLPPPKAFGFISIELATQPHLQLERYVMYDSYYRLPQIECQSNQLNLVVFFKRQVKSM